MYLVYNTTDQDTKNKNYLKLSEFCSFIRPQANQKQKNPIEFKMLSLDADHYSARSNIRLIVKVPTKICRLHSLKYRENIL